MKNQPSKLSDEKTDKELKRFLIAGYIFTSISLFIFGFLAVAGLAFGARCIALSMRPGNTKRPKSVKLKTASLALFSLSLIGFLLYLYAQ
jgi:hypothetical protein